MVENQDGVTFDQHRSLFLRIKPVLPTNLQFLDYSPRAAFFMAKYLLCLRKMLPKLRGHPIPSQKSKLKTPLSGDSNRASVNTGTKSTGSDHSDGGAAGSDGNMCSSNNQELTTGFLIVFSKFFICSRFEVKQGN